MAKYVSTERCKAMLKWMIAAVLLAGCSSGGGETQEPIIEYTPTTTVVDTRDAVILAIGQSNMSNTGSGFYYVASNDVKRIDSNYNAVLAESPVLENNLADANGGSFLPLLGDLLIEGDKLESVTYANVAVGGTCIIQWTPDYVQSYFNKIREVARQDLDFTHIIFHQGECDTADWKNTSISDYKARFLKMLQGIRDLGIDVPIYVARTSYVFGVVDPRIIQAHNELIEEYSDVLQGPYTDVMGAEYRHDDAHFNERGLIRHAEMWYEALTQ